MNNIIIYLDHSDRLVSTYQQAYPGKSVPVFAFDTTNSVSTNLNNLALFSLHPSTTLSVLYSYKPIFLDLLARWVRSTDEFENKYGNVYTQEKSRVVRGSVVLNALSRVVGLSPESTNIIEYFLQNNKVLDTLESQLAVVAPSEIESILLAYYRLLKYDTHRFKPFVSNTIFDKILKLQDSKYAVSKYLSVHILAETIDLSETTVRKMISTHLSSSDLKSTFENDQNVDYNYLELVESKRLSNFTKLPQVELNSKSKRTMIVSPTDLSPLTISICGVLVPKLVGTSQEKSSLPSPSPTPVPESTSSNLTFVPTDNSIQVLRQLAHHIQHNQSIMLYGKAGSGKTFLINQLARQMAYDTSIIKIHLGEQTDAKMLLGTYTSGEKPGTFVWKSGVLTSAVKEGKWILIEDIDKAPTDVLSILLTLLEKRELTIPSRGEVIKAKNGFQIISTIRTSNDSNSETVTLPDMIGLRLWKLVKVELPSEVDLREIILVKFPLLSKLIHPFIKCYNEISKIYASTSFISLNKGSNPRVISFRDLMKFCSRCNTMLVNEGIITTEQLLETSLYDNIFAEAIDCFGSSITEHAALVPLVNVIGETLEIPTSRINLFLTNHVPNFIDDNDQIRIGRALLQKSHDPATLRASQSNHTSFAKTNHSLRLMEQIGVSIQMVEPILLVGETGTGKTTIVQQISKMMNKKLIVINVSQQTESGDLLGGYKPVNTKTLIVPIQDEFQTLFRSTFSKKKNEKFDQLMTKCLSKNQWKNVIRLWKEAVKLAKALFAEESEPEQDESANPPSKKRKLTSNDKKALLNQWLEFEGSISKFEISIANLENSFVFNFIEGSLVKAVKNGDWLLLDEINLASSDTLESIVDLLSESLDQRSLLLTEKGDIEPIKAHPDFRIFGCMNPSTDIGKKDLPISIRSRFSEIYVHSPDRDISDLLMIIDKYIHRYAIGDEWVGNDIAELYLEAKRLSESNQIVDGANQRPHFSIRTLTRTLVYVCDIVSIYGLRRSLYEGFCMSFLTLLDIKSEAILKPVITKHTLGRLKNANSVIRQIPPAPSSSHTSYVQFKHYWMKKGPGAIVPQPHYIITPFVEKNMLNLVRATAGRRFPVLVQGPTSAGKTSMINYLANITGHKFVRINNHEHTDLQEYLGTYISDSTGKLTFKEGILVEALRKGHWIVLDELNLAPTDVLEALNRLLDDNRELFIPETQETVHPHPDFMLFATQNPPGLYGGRKVLSRAFRNRFLELHFDDIPQDELEIILKERCQIAPSYGKKIVEVYRQLSIQRQSSRLFEQKNSFATLRDLFRWALRSAVGYEELAANGYMLLAERVRKDDEKKVVQQVIEKVMRVKLDMDAYYESLEEQALRNIESSIVWTKSMRRLAVLVFTSMKYQEPLLLVGETGCGKTTVCQVIAQYLGKELVTVNAHQNTETGDILGAQRPVRNKLTTKKELIDDLTKLFGSLQIDVSGDSELDTFLEVYDSLKSTEGADQELLDSITQGRQNLKILFEWNDGPLIQAMKQGNFFLLDEISLADDSVLERLNSVLEPERSLLLAEKGTDDAFITADQGFEFLATMNPGGDYGKKELSPALRNRFTEIWVPSMNDFNDVREIVSAKLQNQAHVEPIVEFSQWFGKKFGGGHVDNGIISLRDILAWVQFINACPDLEDQAALLHGASMVFIDALGTNNTAYLAENEARLKEQKEECVTQLSKFAKADLMVHYLARYDTSSTANEFRSGPFKLPRLENEIAGEPFNLKAPTTAANAMRVVRAMQVHKPILLEGSPGVGKTSLITALSKATGNPLVRINLSEQTDLVDLFGSDTPSEGGKTGEFVWRDAPFLRAMQRGEWVLLDEMNLASQSVLEGLNACLDHRGEAYIPELDKSFVCHPEFKVFAAQNPQYQGGGRKGLPKSFVNRFSVVYVDVLKSEDLNLISTHLFPSIEPAIIAKLIQFISKLEEEVVVNKKWGSSGGPWEFNLRDTLRWLAMYSAKSILEDLSPNDFFEMIVCQRFRSEDDRSRARALFESIFGPQSSRDLYYGITEKYLQIGDSLIKRNDIISYKFSSKLVPLQSNYSALETTIRCINHNLPLIITGPTNSGKTELIRFIGGLVGAKIDEFAMNSDVDSMDILGGYEQVDFTRTIIKVVDQVREIVTELLAINLRAGESNSEVLSKTFEFLNFISSKDIGLTNYSDFHAAFAHYSFYYTNEELTRLASESATLQKKISEDKSVKFDWFDGLLVQAVEKGNWLVLDNANLCSPSVLDRLNSLLETNGVLVINECSTTDGQPRIIKPHPNFRLFLTVDPKYGELSRAMRNRGIEIYLEPLAERATQYDSGLLGSTESPLISFTPAPSSHIRPFALLEDLFNSADITQVQEVTNIAVATLPLLNSNEIGTWLNVVLSSSDFSETSKTFASELSTKIDFLQSKGLLNKLYQIYEPIAKDVDEIVGLSTQFGKFQSAHPLFNAYITARLTSIYPAIDTSESNYFFEVTSRIIRSKTSIADIANKALNGKVNELNYIEKSAAYQLGRDIKNPPRLEIYKFMEQTSVFVENVFDSSIQSSLFTVPGLYKSVYELQLIWESMLETSYEQDESKLRVYQELISKWIELHSSDEILNNSVHDLKLIVSTFVEKLTLTTGYSMDRIWEAFRGEYPKDSKSWKKLEKLIALAAEFDEVASEQFDDSRDSVISLRKLIIDVYEDIKTDRIGDEEFGQLYETLDNGIKSLKEVSSKFITKRQNDFQHEIKMLSNFVESEGLRHGKDVSEAIQSFASTGNIATSALLTANQDILFKPYPSIFTKLWNKSKSDGSYVSGLFYYDLILSTLEKVQKLPASSGKFLQQKLDDVTYLKKELINNSQSVLSNQVDGYKLLLIRWILKVLQVHYDTFAEEDRVSLEQFDEETLAGLTDSEPSKQSLATFQSVLETSDNEFFRNFSADFLIPAVTLVAVSKTISDLGSAWVLFSCGAIQLYVPSSSYDPAIKEHVIYKKFMDQQLASQKLIDEWKSARKVLIGDTPSHIEELLPVVDSSSVPNRPRVYRSTGSIDILFEEWKAFMDSTIDAKPIQTLLENAQSLSASSSKRSEMFQNNSDQFLLRLSKKYLVYSDLNDILMGYVYGLKFGFELLSVEAQNKVAKYQFDPLWPVNVVGLSNLNSVESSFEHAKQLSKSLSTDSIVPEYLMAFFIRLSFAHSYGKGSDSFVGGSIVEQSLETLYYRWSLRRMKQEEEEAQEGKLYKYTDIDGDAEADFKAMFPDHEDIVEVDQKSSRKNESFDEFYYTVAKIYMDEFLFKTELDLQTLVEEGSQLMDIMSSLFKDTKANQNNASILASLVSRISSTYVKFTVSKDEFDFYRGTSTAESKKAIGIVTAIHTNVVKLLAQWPEHATLQNIATATDEYLSLAVQVPISRLLQKIEQIYTIIAEWEKYASSEVTLKVFFDELTSLIVSWRKLELSTWKSLFAFEESTLEKNLGKWWFHLFEVIIIPILSGEPEALTPVKILTALNLFMSQATYGEYASRLNILKSFKNHTRSLVEGDKYIEDIHNSLSNFIQFYEQFLPLINETIAATKTKLQKDISEVILLASWKDVNIDALKQSAKRSHNNLYKIVRKYRALLATQASPLISGGLNTEIKAVISAKEAPVVGGLVIDKEDAVLCSAITTWKGRPARIQDITLVEKNMNVYVTRVEEDNIPNLYPYTKEVVEDMDRLRKETPKELKKDNKKLIAALKTQKRKLLSDTIRELRRMGLKTTLKSDIMEFQGSVNQILCNSTNFENNFLEGSDGHFFRILDLLPRLRASVSELSEDVPPADAQKGLAAAENLINSLIATRAPLNTFAGAMKTFTSVFNSFEKVSFARNSNQQVLKASLIDSTQFNIESVRTILYWLPKLIEYINEVIQSNAMGDSIFKIFSKAKVDLSDLSYEIKQLDDNVHTEESISFINKFKSFYKSLTEQIETARLSGSKDAFIAEIVHEWISTNSFKIHVQSSTSLTHLQTLESLELVFRELTTSIIMTVQKVTELIGEKISEEDDGWLKTSQSRVIKLVKALRYSRIINKVSQCIELVSTVEHNSQTAEILSALTRFTLPLVKHYYKLCWIVLSKTRTNYIATSHATFILASSLHTLATKGFCSPEPPSEQKDDPNLQDGTGLGDGEGAENNSKDVEEDEDLTEDAQKPNEEQKEKDEDEEENDDAVEMEGDMAGDLEEASDQEDEGEDGDEEENEMDEEIDDIDDLDPNAIDEKMWDEEAKDDKEKDSDKMPENSTNDDNMEANEDEDNKSNDKQNPQESKEDAEEEPDKEEDGDEGDEEQDVGEQEDEVKNDENEKLEDHVPETETLELPEDMKLDGDEEEDGEEDEGDDKFDDKMDAEEEQDEQKEDEDASKNIEEGENEEENQEEEGDEDENMDAEEDDQQEGEQEAEPQAGEEPKEDESDEETLGEKPQEEEQEEGGNDNKDMEQETAEGADAANDEANTEDVDMESAVKQESGEKGDGADNQVVEENDDIGATGGASSDSKQQEDNEDITNQDDARDMAKESLKQLGDSLKEFHRRRQEIQQASEEKEEKTEESANHRPDEFEHVEGENADFDTQALGAADKDQIQSIDEDMAIDDDVEDVEEEEIKQEIKEEEKGGDDMEVDENAEEVNPDDANIDPENDFEGKTKGAFIGERKTVKEEDELVYNRDLAEEDSLEEYVNLDNLKINELDGEPPIDLETARELWRHSELSTQELASGLCEQLRLILEPTLATKLRGDYKTGKRLNMKRIITYIASEFRKDKIWLRRTKPSKRQYQIMIAVDDSKSMSESKSTELAYHSIALVSKALTQLESGGLSIVRFGEDIKVVHPFDKPFNNQETGSKIFQWFDFQQTRTDIKQLCAKSLKIFEDARSTSNSDLWQLQIILSDGVCEDHESIQRMVRKAREEKIMLVFVVIDGINSNESILEMSQVSYVTDANTGAMNLKVDKYLDTFPFEFYVVVRDINELPEMLSLILRQYFSEMASA